jgi:hypothetical protein
MIFSYFSQKPEKGLNGGLNAKTCQKAGLGGRR